MTARQLVWLVACMASILHVYPARHSVTPQPHAEQSAGQSAGYYYLAGDPSLWLFYLEVCPVALLLSACTMFSPSEGTAHPPARFKRTAGGVLVLGQDVGAPTTLTAALVLALVGTTRSPLHTLPPLTLQCELRYQTLAFDMSSNGWKSLFAQDGIFRRAAAPRALVTRNNGFSRYPLPG